MYVEAGHFDVGFRLRCMTTQLDGLGGLLIYVFESWPLRRTSEERDPGLRGRCQVFCEASDREDTGQEEVRGWLVVLEACR